MSSNSGEADPDLKAALCEQQDDVLLLNQCICLYLDREATVRAFFEKDEVSGTPLATVKGGKGDMKSVNSPKGIKVL